MMRYTEGDWTATEGTGLFDRHGIGTKVIRVFDGKEKEVTVPLALVYNSQTGCGADDAVLMSSAKEMLVLLQEVNAMRESPDAIPFPAIAELVGRLS
jgi:hypothetical protein